MSVPNLVSRPGARRWHAAAMTLLAWVCLWACLLSPAADARGNTDRANRALAEVSLANLPPEAAQTLSRIKRGGPFPYPEKDGSVFGNFEKRLPIQPRGYYREYTVPTPGLRHRGARRIVAGQGRHVSTVDSGEYYYTGNHYRSFRRIREP